MKGRSSKGCWAGRAAAWMIATSAFVSGCSQAHGGSAEPDASSADGGAPGSGDGGAPGSGDGGPERACGGLSGATCAPDEYCDFPDASPCGVDGATGICRPRPEACALGGPGVCGCDGNEYTNACEAAQAGTDVAGPGACAGRPVAIMAEPSCAPWDGPAWTFTVTDERFSCDAASGWVLTLEVWRELRDASLPMEFELTSEITPMPGGTARLCPDPASGVGLPCQAGTGTLTVERFEVGGTAEISWDVLLQDGSTRRGRGQVSRWWCRVDDPRLCG